MSDILDTRKNIEVIPAIPASICALGSATAEILAIVLITRSIYIRVICVCLVIGIETSKLFFDAVMSSWNSFGSVSGNIGKITMRLAAILLSTCCTFILISSDVQSPNETVYLNSIETHYKTLISETEEKNTAAKNEYTTAIQSENSRHENALEKISSFFNGRIYDANEPLRNIDGSMTSTSRINEISAAVEKQVSTITEQWNSERENENNSNAKEISRIENMFVQTPITNEDRTAARETATQLANIDYPEGGKNPAIQNTVKFITTMFSYQTTNMYEYICFLLSLLISIIAESVIVAFSKPCLEFLRGLRRE